MQQGIAVIPKSDKSHHILENTKVKTFHPSLLFILFICLSPSDICPSHLFWPFCSSPATLHLPIICAQTFLPVTCSQFPNYPACNLNLSVPPTCCQVVEQFNVSFFMPFTAAAIIATWHLAYCLHACLLVCLQGYTL